jgi:hypothetical protein
VPSGTRDRDVLQLQSLDRLFAAASRRGSCRRAPRTRWETGAGRRIWSAGRPHTSARRCFRAEPHRNRDRSHQRAVRALRSSGRRYAALSGWTSVSANARMAAPVTSVSGLRSPAFGRDDVHTARDRAGRIGWDGKSTSVRELAAKVEPAHEGKQLAEWRAFARPQPVRKRKPCSRRQHLPRAGPAAVGG